MLDFFCDFEGLFLYLEGGLMEMDMFWFWFGLVWLVGCCVGCILLYFVGVFCLGVLLVFFFMLVCYFIYYGIFLIKDKYFKFYLKMKIGYKK